MYHTYLLFPQIFAPSKYPKYYITVFHKDRLPENNTTVHITPSTYRLVGAEHKNGAKLGRGG